MSQSAQSITSHHKIDPLHGQQLGVLFYHRIARLGQNQHQLVFGERIESGNDWKPSNELGNHAKRKQVFWLGVFQRFFWFALVLGGLTGMESEDFAAQAPIDDFIESDESPATHEEDFLRVDLNIFLVRVFAPS